MPADYLASLREQIARSTLWPQVSDVRNPNIDISPAMVSLIRSRAPMWLAIDHGDGFAVVSMHTGLDGEDDARQWLAAEFCAKAFQGKLKKLAASAHTPGMPLSKQQRDRPNTYIARLLRTMLRVNWQDLSYLDDPLYRRTAALALDIREALLRAQSTVATGREGMGDAVEDELDVIAAAREALAAPVRPG